MPSPGFLLWTAAVAGSACGAATDPEIGSGPFGAPCAETTSPCLPEGGRITLARTPCYGACPVYSVTVDWTGLVVYEGQFNVTVEGHRERQIGAEETEPLFWRLHAASFFDLRDHYDREGDGCEVIIDDTPGLRLGLELPGRSKFVRVGGIGSMKGLLRDPRRPGRAACRRNVRYAISGTAHESVFLSPDDAHLGPLAGDEG